MRRSKFTPGDFKLAVKRASAGRGLFALEDIPKGVCVEEYVGRPITEEQWLKSTSRYLFEISKTKTIDGYINRNRARFINHSCRPNCEIEIRKGRVFVMTKRKIKEGEELGYDYGKDYVDDMIKPIGCKCLKCKPAKPAKKKTAKKKTARKKRAA
ncbi:MAG: SET domain-containing protein [Hyphomicrobiales bacterium]